ncbi:MAG: argininosuccinate lyase [Chloroflexi bacterium]|nr:argininosuccinate lyase [Chloroflexota bacterium]MBM3155137.1 argininosuccinate lyase [Chloroflexota bacterium]MBM3172624.1 argininosuccinate lyase [Chloroflexota bacterium]MBM3174219.1 argininosuccinate lyase [Chloroflexota bacterium]MBM4449888.1 argininosuccinate lyase [Chloroflexota bacterium]
MDKKGRGYLRSRFQKEINKTVSQYVASIPFDWRLYQHDITGSIAHAKMLAKQKIITPKDAESIVSGLQTIQEEIEKGQLEFKPELEDIHMNIEKRLFEIAGDVAGKLHTARSRNDQVALDLRLYIKEIIVETIERIRSFQQALIRVAEANKKVIMPGYTHLQQAQPILFAHHILAYFEMLQRDVERFQDCLKRVNVLPLGSGALAGVSYPIDRHFVAKELGFSQISTNSLDAVSDRDFVIEYQAAAAITMMHLSRLAEEVILWSSTEFGFAELDDAYATSSSIMPQKKNPDVAELARAKTGRVYGNLLGLLTIMKGLPMTYNRDLQEDKEGLFDTVDTLLASLNVLTGLVETMKINNTRMRDVMSNSYILATDLADYLAKKGLPFRQAHEAVSKLVQYAISKRKGFRELTLKEYQRFSPLFDKEVQQITLENSLVKRNVPGGTAPEQVTRALARAKRLIGKE